VVGLPGGIRPIRFSPVDQLKYVAVRFRAFVGESYKVCTQTADDIRNGTGSSGLSRQDPSRTAPLDVITRRLAVAGFVEQGLRRPPSSWSRLRGVCLDPCVSYAQAPPAGKEVHSRRVRQIMLTILSQIIRKVTLECEFANYRKDNAASGAVCLESKPHLKFSP
jgi:hypothetical protein